MYQFVKSIKANDMVKFKVFRNTDVLLIDDIHLEWQEAREEFFHTFNVMIERFSDYYFT